MLKIYLVTPICLCLFFISCNSNKDNIVSQNTATTAKKDNRIQVSSTIVKQETFYKELICNGKVKPLNSAKVLFELQENITEILVANGQLVTENQVLAKLDDSQIQLEYKKAINSLTKAEIELQDILIAHNSNINDTAKIDRLIIKNAKIRSGYNDAILNLSSIKQKLEKTIIRAPFNGVVSRLQAKKNNPSKSYDYLCYVTGNSEMEIVFSIMENELSYIKGCSKVTINSAAITNNIQGTITSIDPFVDDNGMVKITAITKGNNELLEGMNVKVNVLKSFPNKLVVPKEAVVKRDGKDVIFSIKSDSVIEWNYVKVEMENSNSFVINEGITINDTIAITNNQNLGHNVVIANTFIQTKKRS